MKRWKIVLILLGVMLTGCEEERTVTRKDNHDGFISYPAKPLPDTAKRATTVSFDDPPAPRRAVAVLSPVGDSGVTGTIFFTKKKGVVAVTGNVYGLAPGSYALHVHEYGDLTAMDEGESAGDHFNPAMEHGTSQGEKHLGVLGQVEVNDRGEAVIHIEDEFLKLSGPYSIIGRSIVIHSAADEFTEPFGDSAGRAAIGVIGIAMPEDKSWVERG